MSNTTPSQPIRVTLWKVLLAGYGLALAVSTHLPPSFPLLPRSESDKLVHFSAYAGLAWLLAMAWERSTGRLNRRHLLLAWLAIIAFAALDEMTQPWFGRDAGVWDWLADALGAATGMVVFALTRRWFDMIKIDLIKFDKFKS